MFINHNISPTVDFRLIISLKMNVLHFVAVERVKSRNFGGRF